MLSSLVLAFYPREYNDKEVEADFASLVQNGFDVRIARRLGKQFKRSDASYTIHFLAKGYQSYLRNPNAFITGENGNWNDAVAEIKKNGAAASEDWNGSGKPKPPSAGQSAGTMYSPPK